MSAVSEGLQDRRAKADATTKKAEDEAREAATQEENRQRSSRAAFKADEEAPSVEESATATAVAPEEKSPANDADKS